MIEMHDEKFKNTMAELRSKIDGISVEQARYIMDMELAIARTNQAGGQLQYACQRMKEWQSKSLFQQIFNF